MAHQHQPGVLHDRRRGRAQFLRRKANGLAQGMAEQVPGVRHPAGAKQRGGVQDRAQLPRTKASGCLRQSDGAIQQGLVQVVGHPPHPEVVQGALTEGRGLGPEAVQDHLPAFVHHRQLDGIPVANMTIGLQQRREGQQPCVHWRLPSRLRAIALGQCLLQVGVEKLMAVLAQKHEKLPRLAGACGYCLLLRGQGNGRVPPNGLLTGGRDTVLAATYQSTDNPLLSTPLRALPKPLISVLGSHRGL